uniref:AAA+ ATPase domain-containing protein n=1 Tax=viral metagenome TaxID=1070528 RepID=A0A6C0EFQ0_9ZZZZ
MQKNITIAGHESIIGKLNYFNNIHKIPNIIFHGGCGTGKKTIVNQFINTIYNGDKEKIKTFVMYVNCAHGKGIKFIREELKFFAKTHIISNGGDIFKSVILLNADKLTMDAQSALRRCIELFSHSTRFFIVIEDKYKLLKPILSRFCEIYVPELIINNEIINLHNMNDVTDHLVSLQKEVKNYADGLGIGLDASSYGNTTNPKFKNENIIKKNTDFSLKLYEKGFNGLDLISLIERNMVTSKNIMNHEKKFEFLITFNKIRKEFRNEKTLMLFILHFMFLSSDYNLENISFM